MAIIERRLRGLGATYYLLERWGDDELLYRFHCKIAIANNHQHNRHYEAIDTEPLEAMTSVLRQVEIWRSASKRNRQARRKIDVR